MEKIELPLSNLFKDIKYKEWRGAKDITISSIEMDSRRVAPACCFVAVKGTLSDGHDYIAAAIERGAVAVVCQSAPHDVPQGVAIIIVEASHIALGELSSAFYGHPSRSLKLVGVTGTNGKTTTATLLYNMYRALGYTAGLISTVVYRIGEKSINSTHTTPDAIRLNAMLREMVDCGCDYCFMEVSSHSVVQGRIAGLQFAGALFSNITHDHLDYHHTFAEYIRAKKGLFDSLDKQAFALTNIDDRNGDVMLQNCKAHKYSYSLRSMADFRAKVQEMHLDGMLLTIDGEHEVWVGSTGRFNAYNMLAVYSVARLLGTSREEALCALSALKAVCGRFETINLGGGVTAIVDYAHTPDALESVLQTVDDVRCCEGGLIVVCGCGGDRDRTKRGEMAKIATRYASTAIFTSDNPRHERAEDILNEMEAGVDSPSARYVKIVDRREAIRTAMMMARAGDVIVVAGKGHEKYQIVGDEKLPFDDHQVIEEYKNLKDVLISP